MRGLVDPGEDRAAHVVDEVAALAAATLVGAEAVGDELVAAARARRPGDLALEHIGAGVGVTAALWLACTGLQGFAQPALQRLCSALAARIISIRLKSVPCCSANLAKPGAFSKLSPSAGLCGPRMSKT